MRSSRRTQWSIVVSAIPLLLAATTVRATDAAQVLSRMRAAAEPSKDLRANFEFEMTNAKGESVRWTGAYYRRGGADSRMRLVFDSPVDLRGTEVMAARGADGIEHTRVYLPALRRVREIEGDARGESFLGTDFNYDDIGLEQMEAPEYELHGENKIEGRACYRRSSIPARGWWYGKILRFVDEQTYLPLRTEYYDRRGTLWKIRTFDHVKKIDRFPTATEITMRTLPAGTATRITLTDVHYDTGLSDSIFEVP